MRSPGQFEHPLIARAKCEIAAAALGNGVVPAHNVTTELRDTDVVREDARRARSEFGFLRMWSIHPSQIQPIVEAMRPDFAEVHRGRRHPARRAGCRLGPDPAWDGKLHDRASYRYYWELLQRAHATGMRAAGRSPPTDSFQPIAHPHPTIHERTSPCSKPTCQHVAERAALGIPPLPLTKQQTAELVALLKSPPKGEEAFLVDLITHRVPAGVDDAAKVKAEFLADVGQGRGERAR